MSFFFSFVCSLANIHTNKQASSSGIQEHAPEKPTFRFPNRCRSAGTICSRQYALVLKRTLHPGSAADSALGPGELAYPTNTTCLLQCIKAKKQRSKHLVPACWDRCYHPGCETFRCTNRSVEKDSLRLTVEAKLLSVGPQLQIRTKSFITALNSEIS